MLNQLVLVGRIVEDNLEVKKENDKDLLTITLAVNRAYKNAEGVYETDFIPCILWGGVATNTAEYYKKGDIVGVRGRVQSVDGKLAVVAEKLTFLSSKKSEE